MATLKEERYIGKNGTRLETVRGRISKLSPGYLYILPWVIGFLLFQLYPFVTSFIYSFTDFSILKPMSFVGLDNYKKMFTADRLYWTSLKATFKYVLIAVPGRLIFALFIAMILNMKLKCINFFRTVYYLPSILGGSVAISILWRFLFSRNGTVNVLLKALGIPPVDWLGNPNLALGTMGLLVIWQFGSSMVLFLAGLRNIPTELYEAARVDGAGSVKVFFKITLPMLSPIIFFNLIMQTINAFKEFNAPYLITQGGPLNSTYLYGMMLYENAFAFLKMGYASAQSWVLFAIIMLFTALAFKSSPYWTYYEDGGDF
ncbi:MAG: sugar ABC transporter permease [Clostridiaceae bacterium]|nr:sugar ABC transporter permease [Clostridiaceae bacterium]